MYKNKLTNIIISDYKFIISEILKLRLYCDSNELIVKNGADNTEIISWNNKKSGSILYDTSISASKMLEEILKEKQFCVELYDKSVFQFECVVKNEKIEKVRMLYLKKDNKIWSIDELGMTEANEDEMDQWFELNYGMPIMIRIDYDPSEYIELIHSKSHMTISNSENCRIPMKTYFMFSEFVSFILWNFYNIKIKKSSVLYNDMTELSDNELKECHITW